LGAKSKLKREIMIRLDGSHTVCGWLAREDFELWESFEDDFTQYRLAWIDNMIEEFSCGKSSEFSGNTVEITGTTYKFYGANYGETMNFKSADGLIFKARGLR